MFISFDALPACDGHSTCNYVRSHSSISELNKNYLNCYAALSHERCIMHCICLSVCPTMPSPSSRTKVLDIP